MTDNTTKRVEVHMTAVGYDEVDVESLEDVRELTVDDPRFEVNAWEVYDPETDEYMNFEQ